MTIRVRTRRFVIQRALLRIAVKTAHSFCRPAEVKLLIECGVSAELVGKKCSISNDGLEPVLQDGDPTGGGVVAVAVRFGVEGDVHVCGLDRGRALVCGRGESAGAQC